MKYKCQDCGHEFESVQRVYECTQCGSSNIKQLKNSKSILYKVAAIATGVILLILLFGKEGGTDVLVKDNDLPKFEVELKGEQIDKYKITIKRNGADFESRKYTNKSLVFKFEIPGTYTLHVKFIGQGTPPKLSNFKNGPWIISDQPPKINSPKILEIKIIEKNTKTQRYSIRIKTNLQLVPLTETEFSVDGKTFQKSDQFRNLSPGYYLFYVRNSRDISLSDQFQFNLPQIPKTPKPTDAIINDLLKQMSVGNQKAFDRWRIEVEEGLTIPVTGAQFIDNSYALAQDAMQGNRYKVRTNRDSNDNIIQIIVE